MKLDLNEIAHSVGMLYTYEVDDDESELATEDLRFQEPVRGRIQFTNTGMLLLARGKLDVTVDLECVRCLGHFPFRQAITIEEHFPLHPGALAGDEEPDGETATVHSDLDVADDLYRDGILDLTELIRQNVLVSVPLAPLCSEDCAGLCSRCGSNLNEGPCECSGAPDGSEAPPTIGEALPDWPPRD